jgi:hypothetical protein
MNYGNYSSSVQYAPMQYASVQPSVQPSMQYAYQQPTQYTSMQPPPLSQPIPPVPVHQPEKPEVEEKKDEIDKDLINFFEKKMGNHVFDEINEINKRNETEKHIIFIILYYVYLLINIIIEKNTDFIYFEIAYNIIEIYRNLIRQKTLDIPYPADSDFSETPLTDEQINKRKKKIKDEITIIRLIQNKYSENGFDFEQYKKKNRIGIIPFLNAYKYIVILYIKLFCSFISVDVNDVILNNIKIPPEAGGTEKTRDVKKYKLLKNKDYITDPTKVSLPSVLNQYLKDN